MSDDNIVNLDFDKVPDGQQAMGGLVLGNLTGEDWHSLFNLGQRLEFMQDDVILEQNQVNDSLYFITDGRVRIERAENGETTQLAEIGVASIFGEMSFLEKSKISASVIADGHVVVLKIFGVGLDNLIAEDVEFGQRFYRSIAVTLSRRLRTTNNLV
ncbi:MAG: cyclic nucleotide-binding domain-containing protein [Rhodospirillaceae bacterium]|jgi:CRP-like cAMP-binding protein|nr:cyclic nucleotide-binding domain-containing protein [Rhodospirillaceae bacterium]MBT3884403.1 cyclic nucleotide-binding domain-containing protein [Rhodospirillaceae bacterium]MBT4116690.1 cyclic nucleotide-binding domain-containing protein [Rhodospirillaceae bacterium]MBT4673303.1 cyclic nucleotide-binding domain-containing protein [Rhodospirillaceae bacterium]MBT4720284.1 cyclic nucleotide-binding domain-containing protein [Rhodospirillaceae bacterium]